MPRPSGESWGLTESDVLIDWLMSKAGDELSEPDAALERVREGGLTGEEAGRLRVRALEAIRAADWANHTEDMGAVVTGPRDAARSMRERRDRDSGIWRRVLEAIGAGESA